MVLLRSIFHIIFRILLFSFLFECSCANPQLVSPDVCAVYATQQINYSDTCSTLGSFATKTIDLAGMAGERENIQLLIRTLTPYMANISFSGLGKIIPIVRQVGYVDCKKTTRYSPSGGGWHPDPLLPYPTEGILVASSQTTPLWISFDIPHETEPGNYKGTLSLVLTPVKQNDSILPGRYHTTTMDIDIALTVWNLKLPSPAEIHNSFGEIWSFTVGALHTIYGDSYDNQTEYDFFAMMTESLLPPDELYKGKPYSDFHRYEYLSNTGAVLLNLANIGQQPRGCPTPYTPEDINKTLALLEPTITKLQSEGLLKENKAYVYGYDEQPISCEPNIRKLFGAVKDRWPQINTAAVLNWKGGLPVDLPVDIWILQYEEYIAADAEKWKNAGKKQYWYHCIEPSGAKYLNTFIERPWTQGRLLYWLAASNNVDGWLYYATDIWNPYPGTTHNPMRRINSTAFTDFAPANYIWSPRTDIFANGDGQFVYPGMDDITKRPIPIPSARLFLIRDAVEDQQLLSRAMIKNKAQAQSLIKKLVRSPTDHTDDPILLETTRRELAALLQQ